ncbi:MAG: S-methyl-5-thioribose-1-phosphate isomerase [Euryarchaeota archaeon]|nr:S-methyl-5-thioribose-1-phosphate isomerase [Euryarchaeota archaeon]
MRTIELKGEKVVMIDQTLLPEEVRLIECADTECIAEAIESLRIRGAPALGVAAAFALAQTALKNAHKPAQEVLSELEKTRRRIAATRPTAVNLHLALERVMNRARESPSPAEAAYREALRIYEEDLEANRRLGEHGAELLEDGDVVLTHCNTGALATASYGTALGVIVTAWRQGKRLRVFADETRPLLQGARLTAWELVQEGIPVTVITDSSAGYVMRTRGVTKVIVGADRIAANGDTANKIGTYSLAVLAREHRIPFYVAAPLSTIDPETPDGERIPVEYRGREEIEFFNGRRIVPREAEVLNPAFDVTPARYITGIITEAGVLTPPYEESIRRALEGR